MSQSARLTRVTPIFPVSDLRRALAHYESLGFETLAYQGGDDYGFVERDGVELHLSRRDDHHPHVEGGAAYLYVEDTDALFEEWGRPGIAGTTRAPGDTPYRLREGSHVDPDGNLIRFGSPLPYLVRLQSHLASHYGIAVTETTELDSGVFRLRRSEGPSWVARQFPETRPMDAARGDADVLRFLAAQDFPAERLAAPDPLTVLDGQSVLVTDYVEPVPRQERREAVKNNGGLRHLGELLGRLHTLTHREGAPSRAGGAWHHLSEGGPAEEVAAAVRMLVVTTAGRPAGDQALCALLRGELEALDTGEGLPQGLVHPDFVLPNIIASPDRGLVVVDWAGTGRAARAWSLAFLLFAEGAKNLARVDRVVAGYREHIQLEAEELERLTALARARPMTLALWSFCRGQRTLAETMAQVDEVNELAEAIGARARAAFATDLPR
jgi:Ser/Thr protein kinase RdoA (MazF antagonist)